MAPVGTCIGHRAAVALQRAAEDVVLGPVHVLEHHVRGRNRVREALVLLHHQRADQVAGLDVVAAQARVGEAAIRRVGAFQIDDQLVEQRARFAFDHVADTAADVVLAEVLAGDVAAQTVATGDEEGVELARGIGEVVDRAGQQLRRGRLRTR